MNEQTALLYALLFVLKKENEALRSVLSEYSVKHDTDHSEFTQWQKAEDFSRVSDEMSRYLFPSKEGQDA